MRLLLGVLGVAAVLLLGVLWLYVSRRRFVNSVSCAVKGRPPEQAATVAQHMAPGFPILVKALDINQPFTCPENKPHKAIYLITNAQSTGLPNVVREVYIHQGATLYTSS